VKSLPFFSVIIPTYNRADLLPKAIDSVLKQNFRDWELIIVDDGSTDNTVEVVRSFNDARIRYVYQTNAERCAARNNGITHALGKYICFLDSDDYYLSERLQLLYKELEGRGWLAAMLYTGLLIEKSAKVAKADINYVETNNVFDNITEHIIHSQQVCIDRAILEEFKFDPQFRIGEDMELWLRIAQKYPVIYIDDQFTVVVVEHDERSVNVARYNSGAEQLRLYQYIFADTHSGKRISKDVQLFMLAGAYHAIGWYHIHQGNRWVAAKAILQALNVDKHSDWSKFRINILLKLITLSSMEKVKALIDYN